MSKDELLSRIARVLDIIDEEIGKGGTLCSLTTLKIIKNILIGEIK